MFKSIKSKLIILPAIPLMVALYFMGAAIVTRVGVVSEMETLISLSQLSIKISALVHEAQKERGLTAGFVGSKGEKFASELTAQRKTVDKEKNILTAALHSLKTDSLPSDLQSALKKAKDRMSGFESHRRMVDSLSISGDKALSFYTRNNALMIDVIGQVSKVKSDPKLITQLIAYENFLRGKERAGIERAVMNRTFTIDLFEPGSLKRFTELVSEQSTYFNVFNSLATKDQIRFFEKTMSSPIVAQVQKMRDTAFEIDMEKTNSFGIDPNSWFKTMTAKINLMKAVEDRLSNDLNIQVMTLKKEAKSALIVLGIAVLIVLCCVGCAVVFFVRSITKPINQVAQGLTEGTSQIATGSGQVSSSSQALADGASQQAAALEETSSSLEEMSSITAKNAEGATQADKLMKSANLVVKDANDAMTKLTGAIVEIATASEETQKIIRSIDEIAFQTNLLALNAAVEAARAGEAGAGFAVVADEVRNLALSAAKAANDTAAMIEETVKKVNEGSKLVATTNDAFSKVGKSTNTVGNLVEEISNASKEQSEGITQINKAVGELDAVVQQNAASAEENASASEQMAAQSEQMKYLIEDLNTLIGKQRQKSLSLTGSAPGGILVIENTRTEKI